MAHIEQLKSELRRVNAITDSDMAILIEALMRLRRGSPSAIA